MSKFVQLTVKHSQKLYGPEFVFYNVHCLSHLPYDIHRFGVLDRISAFPFENYLQSVKKLEQVIRRVSEKKLISISD